MDSALIGILIAVGIVVLLLVIIGIYLWATYNSFVKLKVRVDEAWSDITVQLKRRGDLIPNIISDGQGLCHSRVGRVRERDEGASRDAQRERRRPRPAPPRVTCRSR